MKYFAIFLISIGFMFTFGDQAFGLWIPQSPQELLEQSQVIFVGNITSVKILEFDKSSAYTISKDDIEQDIVENYTLILDEYTVDVEEFVKNPQESDTITVRQPTMSIPGRVVPHNGFDVGDRVLFYVENFDGENTYSNESFEIPKHCDADSVTVQPRIIGGEFKMIQSGIQKQDNFTADTPIKFVLGEDMRTLYGESFEVEVFISKLVDKTYKDIVFEEKITASSNLCEWVSTATWEFVPNAGKYLINGNIIKENSRTSFNEHFSVFGSDKSPLKQLYSGISPDEVTCKEGLELVQKTNGLAACVTFDTREKLIQRNWASDFPIKHIIDSTYWAKTYLVHHTMCAHIGVWEQTEKDMSAWNMTDTDLEKIPIIKSMIEYNSHGLYSSSEYPKTSTIVSDETQNQHRQNFDNIANSKSDHGSTFWYNGKYYYTDFAIC